MAQASLAGRAFRINPMSLSWDYIVKTSETPTIGGVVVQVFGVDLSDLTLQGAFGSRHLASGKWVGGWEEQDEFLAFVKRIVDGQVQHDTPVRFFYADRGLDYQVKIKSYTEIGQTEAVNASNDNFNPTFDLRLFIVEDNSTGPKIVQDAAMLQYMNRITEGLGWNPKWHGPLTEVDVNSFVASQQQSDVASLLRSLDGSG